MSGAKSRKVTKSKRLWIVQWLSTEGGYSTVHEVANAMANSGDFPGFQVPPKSGQVSGVARILVGLRAEGYLSHKPTAGGNVSYGVTAKCLPYPGA